jgi:tetratricopeptide (TPR) repeat protein
MALQREQIVQTAEKFVARGKIEPAIKEYRKLLAENPNDINTLNRIGDLYARIQRIDEAVDFFTQIAEQYTAEGFFVKAIAIYKKIIKLNPTHLEVYEQLAELYHKQGLVTEARTQYQVLADYYQKHQNAASAIAIYQKMALLEPDNPTYHVKLAEIYHQQQLIEKAMGEYRTIAELMIKHGRPQEAAQVYERALDIDTQNIPFITDAVLKLREAGNAAGAAHFLSVAVERNPQAERIARMVGSEAEVEAEPVSLLSDIELEAEPEPAPPPPVKAKEPVKEPPRPAPKAAPAPPPVAARPIEIEEEDEIDLTFDDDLERAMAEAAAAVGGAEAEAPAAVEEDAESGEIELSLDEMFEIDLPDEDEEPTSLVKPPADLLEAPRRPAWAQDKAPAEPEEIELELDLPLEDLESDPFALRESAAQALPQPELETELSEWQTLPDLSSEPASHVAEDLLDRSSANLREPEREEDLVTEAEVLAKYGLEDKAIERLEEALRVRPDHLSAYALLIQMHLDKERHGKVMPLANRMAEAAAGREPWPKVRKRLLSAGYRLDGDRVTAAPGVAEEIEAFEVLEEPASFVPEPEPEPPQPPPAPPPQVSAPAPPPPAAPPKMTRAKRAEMDELLRGILGPSKPVPRTPAAPRPAPPPPAVPAPAPPVAAAPVVQQPVAKQPPPPPAAKSAPPPSAVFNPLQIGELVESLDLGDEEGFAAPTPGPVFQESFSDSAADLFADPPPPPAAPPVGVNPAALDDTGVHWLDEPPPQETTSAAELFDEEDDFFDLAGELVEELSREEVFQRDGMLVQSEQTLEEIVEGFKKGVAEHLSPTDYDTHFNLGIAYREMGLLDEAVGEFQLAAKDPRYLVLCCSMLGLCFLDKGLPELAIKWYRRALEHPAIGEEDQLGMMYDLGNVYMSMADWDSAYKTFVDLYGINTNYRDVVAKLEELGRPR